MILDFAVLIQCQGETDGQTDGQTPRPWLRRAKHFAIARKGPILLTRDAILSPKMLYEIRNAPNLFRPATPTKFSSRLRKKHDPHASLHLTPAASSFRVDRRLRISTLSLFAIVFVLIQSCSWVNFIDSDPTLSIKLLTQPTTPHPTAR